MEKVKNIDMVIGGVNSDNAIGVINSLLKKLEGDDVVKIILGLIASGTICYICNKGGTIELNCGDKKISFNSEKNKAA